MKASLAAAAAVALVSMVGAASAAQPAGKGATRTVSLGCDALDTTATPFTDPASTLQVVFTPSGNVNAVCNGHLLAGTDLPATAVSFTEKSGTGFVCLQRWEETIEPDGSFTLTCHAKP